MQVVVGRLGRAHGVKGDVGVELRTDEPDRRFAVGQTLELDHAGHNAKPGNVTVTSARWHSGKLLLHFEGMDNRSDVEALRGALLLTEVDPNEIPADPDEYYDHQLVGLSVTDASGEVVGRVVEVVHGPQDLLVIEHGEQRSMVPFVRDLVPSVDLAKGSLMVDLPDGLLDLTVE
jgi:16S rRNA processing protein RimM